MQVYKAINAVQAELCKEGISKDRKNSQQGYSFRGIDDVYNVLSPLLAKHGLCILPRMLSRSYVERETRNGGALFYVTVEAEFDFVCSEDASKHTVKTFGEAMDSADKATNKAMSAAYKYAAFQAFAIPTEGDNDADSATHDVKAKAHKPTDGPFQPDAEEETYLLSVVDKVVACKDDYAAAYYALEGEGMDNDEKVWVWSKLDSKVRSGIKKYNDSVKQQKESK